MCFCVIGSLAGRLGPPPENIVVRLGPPPDNVVVDEDNDGEEEKPRKKVIAWSVWQ